jgi:2-dehydropantoate 2-reductase
MRIVIIGPGALGSLLGAALTRGGQLVTLLGRDTAHLQAVSHEGLQLTRLDGATERVPLATTVDPAAVAGADAVVVLVKTLDTREAMQAIAPYTKRGLVVLTLQNGLGAAERVRQSLGDTVRVLPGITSQAANRLAPGVVVHTGEGPTLIGYPDAADAAAARSLAAAFTESGIAASAVADIDRWIWRKAAVNSAINGLTALGGFQNGVIAAAPELLDAAEIIAEEAATVARSLGCEVGGMRRAVADTALATASNRSSMLQDLEARRPTEVSAIQEAIVAAGARVGVATPATQVVASLIRARERANAQENHDLG